MNTDTSINTSTHTKLGKTTPYPEHYDASLLDAIERKQNRQHLQGLRDNQPLPFYGHDIWNAYELSWLDETGKPHVAIASLIIDCHSPYLIESKSLKLYLNSLNQQVFSSVDVLQKTLSKDLSHAVQAPVQVEITPIDMLMMPSQPPGICLDGLSLGGGEVDSGLSTQSKLPAIHETLYSNLLKSHCPITGQPDWATIVIEYQGHPIEHESLLQYLIAHRHQTAFHEDCIERIFMDVWGGCQPDMLTVYARYTRRGGIDINPWRSSQQHQKNLPVINQRFNRQ